MVAERTLQGFPVTVTFELGNEIHLVVSGLEDLERVTVEYDVSHVTVFRGSSWHQLHK